MFLNFEILSQKRSSEKRQTQKSITWGMIFITLILLLILVGYLIYNLTLERSIRWAVEDVAPKKIDAFLKKAEEDRAAETIKEKVFQKDKLVEGKSPMEAGVAETKIAPAQSEDEDQIARQSKISDTIKLPEQKIVIHFDFNSNELSDEAYADLDEIARFLTKYPNSEIIIEGYTDVFGNYSYNKRLSEFRARIVKNYLVAKGVDPLKINAVGLGAQNFIASNDTEEGRRLNRRVEIKVKTKRF